MTEIDQHAWHLYRTYMTAQGADAYPTWESLPPTRKHIWREVAKVSFEDREQRPIRLPSEARIVEVGRRREGAEFDFGEVRRSPSDMVI